MPTDSFQFRVSWQKLLMGLCLTLIPLSLGGLLIISRTERQLGDTLGRHHQARAELIASGVSRFIDERVMDVNTLAADPVIIEVVQTANASWKGVAPDQIEARIQSTENSWNTPASQAFVNSILENKASRMLRRYRDMDRRFLRITLTGHEGTVIAATHKTLDFYQADEEFWQAAFAAGRGSTNITDVLYDEVSKSYYIGVGVPVLAEGTGELIGVLDALVEVSTIFPLLYQDHDGRTARTLLVRGDGIVVSGPRMTLASQIKSEEFAALAERPDRPAAGYLVVDIRGTPTLVAFASTGLQPQFKNLAWTVIAAQDVREAFAPIRTVVRWISLLAFSALAMVTLAAMWFSLHTRREYSHIAEEEAAPADHAEARS